MVAGINGGEGCSVRAWREFIFRIQVQVLCEIILWWWRYNVERAFGARCTKYSLDIRDYFLRELQRVRERKNAINDERLHQV
jgi:hypothetical protein